MKTFTELLARAKSGEWTDADIAALNSVRVPKEETKEVKDSAFRISDGCAKQLYKALCGTIATHNGVGKIKGIGRVIVLGDNKAKTETGRVIDIADAVVEHSEKDFIPLYDRGIMPGSEHLTQLMLAIQNSSIEDRIELHGAMYRGDTDSNMSAPYGCFQHLCLFMEATDTLGGSNYKGQGPLFTTSSVSSFYILNKPGRKTGNGHSWNKRTDGGYGMRVLSNEEVTELAKLPTVAEFWSGVKLG